MDRIAKESEMKYVIQATHYGDSGMKEQKVWWDGHDWTNDPTDARMFNTRGAAVIMANAVAWNVDDPESTVVAV